MTTVVYTGPTLSAGEVREVVPAAVVRPPVARGDLLAHPWEPGDSAIIVDGYYRERLSVGHKEILWLIGQGVHVVGTASMGALRAAELGPYGMAGAGEVHRMYTDGEIDGDDEVAVLHGPAERGYPPSTIALVNLRYGCREGVARGLIAPEVAERVVAVAKELPFSHRTWPELRERLGRQAHDGLTTLEKTIGTGEWDLKRLDAVQALRGAGAGAAGRAPVDAMTGITHYEVLKWRSMREYAPGRWMGDLDVLNAARLFDPDYAHLHEEVLTGLLEGFAGAGGLDAFARARLGLDGGPLPEELTAWLTPIELGGLPPAEQARLVMVRVWPVWQSSDWRPAGLDRVRASPQWPRWCELVERADELTEQTRGRLAVPPPQVCGKLFLRHWQRPGASVEIELARRGFYGLEELGRTARRFFALDVRTRR
ncbi:TfuA-like protein [Nonomuraea sp. NPDC050663]|uniref:TfuA-like protein n=1 Tax=Nonomuraea sp. NPDC050663 TaxID=3364370 RepID=UPI0037B64D76